MLIVPDRSDIRIATNELGQCETASVRENASEFTQVFSGLLQKFSDFDKFLEVQAFYDVFMRMNAVGL